MKKCSRCKRHKPPESFRRRNAAKDGLTAACTPCLKKAFKVYYGDNRKRVIAAVIKRRWISHKEARKLYPKASREDSKV